MIHRRRFLTCAIGLLAAPAIVRYSSLMPIKPRWMTRYSLNIPLTGVFISLSGAMPPGLSAEKIYLFTWKNYSDSYEFTGVEGEYGLTFREGWHLICDEHYKAIA